MKRSSVFDEIDRAQTEPELSLKAKIGLCLGTVLLFALIIGGAWLRESNALAEESARIEGQKVVAAMMVSLPQKTGTKRKTKMVKIARGTTGQADLRADLGENPYCNEGSSGWWFVGPFPSGGWVSSDVGGSASGEPGWGVTIDGSITVPAGAAPGLYRALFFGEVCPGDPSAFLTYEYEFEVVCMTVTLSLTP